MCATGSEALRGAAYAVAAGICDVALAIGVEKLKDSGQTGVKGPAIIGDNPDGSASIDLTDPVLQSIGSGFLVSPTSVTDSNGALRVRGRIVNETSLDQARAEFRLAVGGREVPFTVARIGAGDSAPFVVELPQSAAADVRSARMRWTRSSVSYGED